ncbi:MAG TPA: hypothetical protein VIP05_10360 [Burkholderiaceae bacterium]
MSDPVIPTPDADARLAQADALHDDEPPRALELLRSLDVAALSTGRLGRLSFLLDHVTGEKFGLWDEALAGQQAVVRQAGAQVTPLILRHAAIAAHVAGDESLERDWTQALAASADAPLAKARTLVALGALQFAVSRLPAETAGRRVLHALQPLGELHESPGTGLDAAFGAITNNIASELVERPLDDLAQPDLREALARCADHARRFWQAAGTWVNRERAHYLCAMAANALGHGDEGAAHARAGLALLDEFDADAGENVDRAFLELEFAASLRLAGQPGRPEALARALALASRFGEPWLDRWFSDRQTRNEALAERYGR